MEECDASCVLDLWGMCASSRRVAVLVLCVCMCLYVRCRDLTAACGRVRTSSWLVTRRAVYLIFPPLQPGWECDVCVAVVALASKFFVTRSFLSFVSSCGHAFARCTEANRVWQSCLEALWTPPLLCFYQPVIPLNRLLHPNNLGLCLSIEQSK